MGLHAISESGCIASEGMLRVVFLVDSDFYQAGEDAATRAEAVAMAHTHVLGEDQSFCIFNDEGQKVPLV